MEKIESLIRQQDWHYPIASTDWRDGLLLGNGDLAAVAYAPAHLEWILNKVDIFDPTSEDQMLAKRLPHAQVVDHIKNQPLKNTLFLYDEEDAPEDHDRMRSTISPAILRLRFWQGIGWAAPSTPLTSQKLNFYDGEIEETMSAHTFHPVTNMFIPRDTTLFCLRIREPEQPKRIHVFELLRPFNDLLPAPQWTEEDGITVMEQTLPGGKHRYAVAICIVSTNQELPKVTRNPRNPVCTELLQEGDADVFISIKSSLSGNSPVQDAHAECRAARAEAFESLRQKNRAWWHQYWNSSYANFDNMKEVQKYYTFSLYELACAYGKAPMPGLNGVSYGPIDERTPGVGCQGYTHDQNTQISALALMPSNHVEFITALTNTYWNVRDFLRQETKKLFGCEGIFLPVATNQLGIECPTRAYRYTLLGSAFTAMVLAKAWQYSRDTELLKNHIFPLMRELVLFHTELMTKGEDGTYVLDWSVPPEIFTLTRNDNETLALLKVALEATVEGAKLLGEDADRLPRWEDILAHYPEFTRTPEGAFWEGTDVPLDHYFFGGQLCFPFFPTGISRDRDAMQATLDLIAKDAVERSGADFHNQWHLNHEWSMFLTTGAKIWMCKKAESWTCINRFLELFAKENGLFSHDPIIIGNPAESETNEANMADFLQQRRKFADGQLLTAENPEVPHPICVTPNPNAKRLAPAVLEGNSSFVFLTSQTLLQSFPQAEKPGAVELLLFPCVPDDFTGEFWNLLAQGGFLVSAAMKKGRLTKLAIRSKSGGKCKILLPDGKSIEVTLAPGQMFEPQIS